MEVGEQEDVQESRREKDMKKIRDREWKDEKRGKRNNSQEMGRKTRR
jgi:hypothetical protein